MKKSFLGTTFLALLAAASLAGCSSSSNETTAETAAEAAEETTAEAKEADGDLEKLVVGASPAPHAEILEAARDLLADKGYDLEIVEYTDYVQPNNALESGDLDANYFQHKPYLDQQIKDRGYKLVAAGNTFVYPIAGYSKKIKSLDELQDGAQVAVPNDPTNLGRSLLLLQKVGLIKLKDGVGLLPTSLDIVENPKNLKIVELEAPQLPRSLDDAQIALAVINTTYASQINLTPAKDGIFVEDKESPYVNLIVTREDNKDAENVKKFVQAYQSDEVYEAANKVFNGGAVKGW